MTVILMRPKGVMNKTKAASSTHQLTVTNHGTPLNVANTLLARASHVAHCRPVRVVSGRVATNWASSASRGTGLTTRGSTSTGGASSSR
ncbi:Uncharacterised protein [Mycobacteroides abscessus subsp. abscessus]|nr:Uncharacterised protein [Mycobacteroides abscessus subsp. abscessus]